MSDPEPLDPEEAENLIDQESPNPQSSRNDMPEADPATKSDLVYCSTCSGQVSHRARACPSCGEPMNEPEEDSNTFLDLLCVITMLATLASGFVLYSVFTTADSAVQEAAGAALAAAISIIPYVFTKSVWLSLNS